MNISGLLITTAEGQAAQAVAHLTTFPGLEIYQTLPNGQVVAVLERESTDDEVAAVRELHTLDGVLSVVMAYHDFEDEMTQNQG